MTTTTYTEYRLKVTSTTIPGSAINGPYLTEDEARNAFQRITSASDKRTATFEIQAREVTVTDWDTTSVL